MRIIFAVLAVITLILVALVLLVRIASRKLIYQTTTLAPAEVERIGARAGWKLVRLEPVPSLTLTGLVRAPPRDDAPWILFFGGNASNIDGNRAALELVAESSTSAVGLAVFAYRGYDGSGGSPSQKMLTEDARAVAQHLLVRHGVKPARLVLLGQSLGSGVAANLAARLSREGTPPRALVLMSPYQSMARVFDDHVPILPIGWAVRDRYDTEAILATIQSPISIVHGSSDRLIAISHSHTLAKTGGTNVRLTELEGVGHNELWSDTRTIDVIRAALVVSPSP